MKRFLIKLKWILLRKEILDFSNGDLYIGDIGRPSYIPKSWGTRTGEGAYFWANGNIYEGSFIEGIPDGKGILRYLNGNTYKGSFKDGKPHGPGLMKYSDGSSYEGRWRNGKRVEKRASNKSKGALHNEVFIDFAIPEDVFLKQGISLNSANAKEKNNSVKQKSRHGLLEFQYSKN